MKNKHLSYASAFIFHNSGHSEFIYGSVHRILFLDPFIILALFQLIEMLIQFINFLFLDPFIILALFQLIELLIRFINFFQFE